MEFHCVQVYISRRQYVQMNMIKSISHWHNWPVHDVPNTGIGWNITTCLRICLPFSKFIVDQLGNRSLINMMILPNITLFIQNRYLPIDCLSWLIVLDVDHLSSRACEHLGPVRGNHVNSVMKICRTGPTAVILVRLDRMPHLYKVEGPVIDRMGSIWIPPCNPKGCFLNNRCSPFWSHRSDCLSAIFFRRFLSFCIRNLQNASW